MTFSHVISWWFTLLIPLGFDLTRRGLWGGGLVRESLVTTLAPFVVSPQVASIDLASDPLIALWYDMIQGLLWQLASSFFYVRVKLNFMLWLACSYCWLRLVYYERVSPYDYVSPKSSHYVFKMHWPRNSSQNVFE